MFTGHIDELVEAQLGETERSRSAGFVGTIAKPFDLQTLDDVVMRAVDERQLVWEGSRCGIRLFALRPVTARNSGR